VTIEETHHDDDERRRVQPGPGRTIAAGADVAG
jgi:hypothetical protein